MALEDRVDRCGRDTGLTQSTEGPSRCAHARQYLLLDLRPRASLRAVRPAGTIDRQRPLARACAGASSHRRFHLWAGQGEPEGRPPAVSRTSPDRWSTDQLTEAGRTGPPVTVRHVWALLLRRS